MICALQTGRRFTFGNVLMRGTENVRLAYLDEGGRSNISHEPHMVVAGIILDPDGLWLPLEAHLRGLVTEHLPPGTRRDFVFHAMDLWHGNKDFPRDKWPREKRWKILDELVAIPKKFNLPIVATYVDRREYREAISARDPNAKMATVLNIEHGEVFMQAAMAANRWMGLHAPKEVAMLIAEESGTTRAALKKLHAAIRDQETPIARYLCYVDKIIDTVHFAERHESPLLQIADVCAFFIRRRLAKKKDSDRFYDALKSQVVFSSGKMVPEFATRPIDPKSVRPRYRSQYSRGRFR